MPLDHEQVEALHALAWWVDAGWDVGVSPVPTPWWQAPVMAAPAPRPELAASQGVSPRDEGIAVSAESITDLRTAIANFNDCALKATALNTVFADGLPGAELMVLGEAPGADEDRLGRPFVGKAGQLLDRMLAAIGRSRVADTPAAGVYISNILFWRPPGNRTPTAVEVAQCLPFTRRHIALARPKALLLVGGVAASALFGDTNGITALRGKWRDMEIDGWRGPVLATFHPAFLLRQPARKADAWHDLLEMSHRLQGAA